MRTALRSPPTAEGKVRWTVFWLVASLSLWALLIVSAIMAVVALNIWGK